LDTFRAVGVPVKSRLFVLRGLPAILALGMVLAFSSPTAVAAASAEESLRFRTVVLDPGHGGDDHGAEGAADLLEKDVVLDVAERLATHLRAAGLEVVKTRGDDRFVPLEERTRIANGADADLFISIHANAAPMRGARGIETFFASPEATDAAALELASQENEAFGEEAVAAAQDDALLAILGDLLATEHLSDSQEFARMAQHRIATKEAARSRGVKQAPFVVLMGVRMPAVLVEIGFLTNPHDQRALRRVDERERLARELAAAVASFRQRQDARVGVAAANGGG
jgi:N-acetylmuramoyl-L-alanine amidase